jgi:hypothetical protein
MPSVIIDSEKSPATVDLVEPLIVEHMADLHLAEINDIRNCRALRIDREAKCLVSFLGPQRRCEYVCPIGRTRQDAKPMILISSRRILNETL